MRVVALGGSGLAGQRIASLLGPHLGSGDEMVLVGRDRTKLNQAANDIRTKAKVSITSVDLDEPGSDDVIDGANLVVMTASRPDLVGRLAERTLGAGADWFDTLLSTTTKWDALRALESRIESEGRCFVTDGGFHPGLPAVLVRWAANQTDELIEADVIAGFRLDWHADEVAESTLAEMLDEFVDVQMTAWIDGRQQKVGWSKYPSVDFGAPIGRKTVVPMPLPEMDPLPQWYPTLRRCGFYVSGFAPMMDYLAFPLILAMMRVHAPHQMTQRFTRWSMKHLASVPPPHRLVVRLDAHGTRHGEPVRPWIQVSGDDGYLLTAVPAVGCLIGMIDGSGRKPGLHLQAHLVDPEPFLAGLRAAGLMVETRFDGS